MEATYTCNKCKQIGTVDLFGLTKAGTTYKRCIKCRDPKAPSVVETQEEEPKVKSSLHTCIKCKVTDHVDKFGLTKAGTAYKKCIKCRDTKEVSPTEAQPSGIVCRQCKQSKGLEFYSVNKSGQLYKACKACRKEEVPKTTACFRCKVQCTEAMLGHKANGELYKTCSKCRGVQTSSI